MHGIEHLTPTTRIGDEEAGVERRATETIRLLYPDVGQRTLARHLKVMADPADYAGERLLKDYDLILPWHLKQAASGVPESTLYNRIRRVDTKIQAGYLLCTRVGGDHHPAYYRLKYASTRGHIQVRVFRRGGAIDEANGWADRWTEKMDAFVGDTFTIPRPTEYSSHGVRLEKGGRGYLFPYTVLDVVHG